VSIYLHLHLLVCSFVYLIVFHLFIFVAYFLLLQLIICLSVYCLTTKAKDKSIITATELKFTYDMNIVSCSMCVTLDGV
jgi:hypothetical protein